MNRVAIEPLSARIRLVALDLERSGAQDCDQEVILEIALVPIVNWQPDLSAAYSTLINPGRTIGFQPGICTRLTDAALGSASTLIDVEPQLSRRINGRYLVGHNIEADWQLLHRRCPELLPAGLINTRRLAQLNDPAGQHDPAGLNAAGLNDAAGQHDLAGEVERRGLGQAVTRLAVGSEPHRVLWDSVAIALLLPAWTRSAPGPEAALHQLFTLDGVTIPATRSSVECAPSLLQFFE